MTGTRNHAGVTIGTARITSILSCPTCGRPLYAPTIRTGEAWLRCNLSDKARRSACPAHWFNLTLAPGATGRDIARVVGEVGALLIVATIVRPPWNVPADHVMSLTLLSEPGRPVHVQVPCRARDEHHLRYAPASDVVSRLLRV